MAAAAQLITPEAVEHALLNVRDPGCLAESPLCRLAAVRARTRSTVPDGVALAAHLADTIRDRLADARRTVDPVRTPDESTAAAPLAADFLRGSKPLEAWSVLYHRFGPPRLRPCDIERLVGGARRTVHRRADLGFALLADALAAEEAALALRRHAPAADRNAAREAIVVAVRDGGQAAVRDLPPVSAAARAPAPVTDVIDLLADRLMVWAAAPSTARALPVTLTLMLDAGEEAIGNRWRSEPQPFGRLSDVLAATAAQAIVVVGAPGAGKTTLLGQLEAELAAAALAGSDPRLPWSVSLAEFGEAAGAEPPDPAGWLAARWHRSFPELPPLAAVMDRQGVVLLLDGLNEIPHRDAADYRARVAGWRRFIRRTLADRPPCRAVFACRDADYSTLLSGGGVDVPQVAIQPLDDAQVQAILTAREPELADGLWSLLLASGQVDAVRNPYVLTLLIEHVAAGGDPEADPAALFTSLVQSGLRREIGAHNPRFEPGVLVTERDHLRLARTARWTDPYALPDGALVAGLGRLAYALQAGRSGTEGAQVVVGYGEACRLAAGEGAHDGADDTAGGGARNAGDNVAGDAMGNGAVDAVGDVAGDATVDAAGDVAQRGERIVQAALDLGLLVDDRAADTLSFGHQLLQEYFAARTFAAAPDVDRVRVPHLAADVSPPLAEALAGLAPADPLPPPPGTPWDQSVPMAVVMSTDADALLAALRTRNPVLAARSAAQAACRASASAKEGLRTRLLELIGDDETDLRVRIAAGHALGDLGDPRFTRQGADDTGAPSFFLPPFVDVPAGTYPIGSDGAIYAEEAPAHSVRLSAFAIARYPVTCAEWACFIADGGYDDARWWPGEAAAAWRAGIGTGEGVRQSVRDRIDAYRQTPDLIDRHAAAGHLRPHEVELWRVLIGLRGAALEDELNLRYPDAVVREPRLWRTQPFRSPSAPVLGIAWHEAHAYARWLAARSGLPIRLPSEVEWEAAARGPSGRTYPFGDAFDAAACNTSESHIRRTVPVGVFPRGDAWSGAADMAGNAFDWTSSMYGPGMPFAYPYVAGDGREALDAPASGMRVQRGGSWVYGAVDARAACRFWVHPASRTENEGMRLVMGRSS